MQVAITGHNGGLGLAIFNYFLKRGDRVVGFSRSNGFNISTSKELVLASIKDFDIFVNNAYSGDNSQQLLLEQVYNLWAGQDKIIINISSRYTNGTEQYCNDKNLQDLFCKSKEYTLPHILNLKPGLIDTNRVKHIPGKRMTVDDVVNVLDFALNNNCKVHSITFGHINV
jgi:hypothetical protein